MRARLFAVLLTLTSAPAWAETAQTLRVHVSAQALPPLAEPERKTRLQQTEAERKRLTEARKAAEKTAQAAHGKKRQAWPEEVRNRVEEADRLEGMATLAHHELKTEQKDLDDLASFVREAFAEEIKEQPRLALADSPERCDLKVELLARRAHSSFPAAAWILYLKVSPVPAGDASAFSGTSFGQIRSQDAYLGQIMGMQRLEGAVGTLHLYGEKEPFWVIEVLQKGTSYGPAALGAAQAVATFAASLGQPAAKAAP